jgi:hypothetical protein
MLVAGVLSATKAQIRKIPSAVTDAFASRYPHAEKVSWKDNITSFEAGFELNDVKMYADFTSKGEWLQTEKSINFEQLPAEVQDGFNKSKYTDWEKKAVIEIDKPAEAIQYRILIHKSTLQKKYLYFDADGKLSKEALTL